MRVVIAGSRSVGESEDAYARLKAAMYELPYKPSEIVSGGATGPDRLGERFASEHGIPVRRFVPDWDGKGKGAGFLRNGDMAVYASDVKGSWLVALWDGISRGTKQMIDVAATYGLLTKVVRFELPGLIAAKDVTPDPFIFKQSHSSLNVFETCPRQYEAKYITKEVKFVQSQAAAWGDSVHIALENYLNTSGSQRLPANMAQYEEWGAFILARAARRGGRVYAERKSAVKKDRTSTNYSDRSGWLGGKIDVSIVYEQERKAEVFDWKTGKVKNEVTQLKMYNGFTLADFPNIDVVNSGYIWLEHKQVSPPVVTTRAELNDVWSVFQHKYDQLKDAYIRGVFPPKPNGLCRQWCDVTSCEFHGKGRY